MLLCIGCHRLSLLWSKRICVWKWHCFLIKFGKISSRNQLIHTVLNNLVVLMNQGPLYSGELLAGPLLRSNLCIYYAMRPVVLYCRGTTLFLPDDALSFPPWVQILCYQALSCNLHFRSDLPSTVALFPGVFQSPIRFLL